MDTSLNAYYSELDKALKKGKKFANFNNDLNHATIVVCTAIRHANSHVKLLSHCLDSLLYGSDWFLRELNGFLNRGGMLDILIESDVAKEHPVLEIANRHKKVTIKRIPDELKTSYRWNFMVVDDIGFRVERNRDSTEASVVFNYDEDSDFLEIRQELTKWFNMLFDSIEQKVA